jgi:hypothetical protein
MRVTTGKCWAAFERNCENSLRSSVPVRLQCRPHCYILTSPRDYTRSTSRTLRYRSGLTEPINLILTKSKVSTQKKRRIAHLVQTRIDFAELADLSWGDVGERKSVSQAATVFINFGDENDPFRSGNISLEDYEATWSVLQAIAMDSGYLTETEYNLFTLIRYGNRHSKVVPVRSLPGPYIRKPC